MAAEGKTWKINLVLSDTREFFVLWIENAVLHHRQDPPAADANPSLSFGTTALNGINELET